MAEDQKPFFHDSTSNVACTFDLDGGGLQEGLEAQPFDSSRRQGKGDLILEEDIEGISNGDGLHLCGLKLSIGPLADGIHNSINKEENAFNMVCVGPGDVTA